MTAPSPCAAPKAPCKRAAPASVPPPTGVTNSAPCSPRAHEPLQPPAPQQGRGLRAGPAQSRQAQGTYPARCFLDLSEMPSRDMSLLKTMMPTSMFTLGGAEPGLGHHGPHDTQQGSGVRGGPSYQHNDGCGSHEGVEQTALQ